MELGTSIAEKVQAGEQYLLRGRPEGVADLDKCKWAGACIAGRKEKLKSVSMPGYISGECDEAILVQHVLASLVCVLRTLFLGFPGQVLDLEHLHIARAYHFDTVLLILLVHLFHG